MTTRTVRVSTGILLVLLVAGSPFGSGIGAVETDEGYRVLLGDETVTFEALEGEPRVNGTLAPEAPTLLEEESVEPWRGYERTWGVNVSGWGSVLVMGEDTGLVLEGDEGDPEAGEDPGEEVEGEDASSSDPEEDAASRERVVQEHGEGEPGAGSKESRVDHAEGFGWGTQEAPTASDGSIGLVVAFFLIAGVLGLWELRHGGGNEASVIVVSLRDEVREVVLVEAGGG